MNSTDFHSLLANSPVSRTTFFTQLLGAPRPQRTTPAEEPGAKTDSSAKPDDASAPAQAGSARFPA